MSSRMASLSKRKTTVPSKRKATAEATRTRAAAAASGASRVRHGSSSAPAPNLVDLSNSGKTAFVIRGSGSSPALNPSAGSIHPQSMPDGFDSSPIHGRRGYPVGFGAVGSSHGRFGSGSISPNSPPFGHQSSWDPARDNSTHPPGGFMGLFNNQPHLSQNSHFVGAPSHYAPFKAPRPIDVGVHFTSMDALQANNGANSSQEVEVLSDQEATEVDSNTENVRTESRILWTLDEDEKLMSAWLKNSTDSSVGADRNNEHYWADVAKTYNVTVPPQRKRNQKQAKDRWHKINRWTDLYECAYLKARRVFTSGYSDQMWIDAADKFYLEDNKKAKLGPFVLKNVWKICRDVAKWKTYNEALKNARKRKSYNIEGGDDENDDTEELLEQPIGQKAAKKAALV